MEEQGDVEPLHQVLTQMQQSQREHYRSLTERRTLSKVRAELFASNGLSEFVLHELQVRTSLTEDVRTIQRSLRQLTPNLRLLRQLIQYYGKHGWHISGDPGIRSMFLLFGFDARAALKESMEEIDDQLGQRLLDLAEDEQVLELAIATLRINTDLHRRLVHANVLDSCIDDEWTLGVNGRREIVEYVIAHHTLYKLLCVQIPRENCWDKSLSDLRPEFSNNYVENDREFHRWVMRQQIKHGISPQRTQPLLNRFKLHL
jgi:hypothetical protein